MKEKEEEKRQTTTQRNKEVQIVWIIVVQNSEIRGNEQELIF